MSDQYMFSSSFCISLGSVPVSSFIYAVLKSIRNSFWYFLGKISLKNIMFLNAFFKWPLLNAIYSYNDPDAISKKVDAFLLKFPLHINKANIWKESILTFTTIVSLEPVILWVVIQLYSNFTSFNILSELFLKLFLFWVYGIFWEVLLKWPLIFSILFDFMNLSDQFSRV